MHHIIDYLQNNHIDILSTIEHEGLPDCICLLYINPFNYYWFRSNTSMLEKTSYRIDGFYASTLFKLSALKGRNIRRQSFDMTSLAPVIFKYCEEKSLKVFVAGGTASEAASFSRKMLRLFPRLIVTDTISGYLTEDEIIEKVKASNCDVAILGLGNMKQEIVATRLFKERPSRYFTCGAFISQTAAAENIHYYPKLIDKLNLRWLYRIFSEKHIFKRILRYYPKFGLTILEDTKQRR